MATKNLSTRMKICGRGAKCSGGHSAVEQSGYICREKMHSEYDGQTYYPKYAEDLVHNEVLLPENAPEEYKDPAKLWNSVEMAEKGKEAQLARTWRIELPNQWTYEFAIMFVRMLCERLFVSKGMCVQFAIHDSENDKGQRNLHCHIMMTLRSLDEQGEWMPKQKKIYLTDENGERIPVIDKKTGKQKVDKQNRKQWKCTTEKTNDWDDQKYGKLWRKELADAINAANAELGLTDDHWEHRSFKEQGLDIEPQIHLGEKASAMERAGIHTIRGDINRGIIERNAIIMNAKAMLEQAKKELEEIKAIPVKAVETVKAIKNEILDVIRAMAARNNNRLTLPVVKGKFIGAVSDRESLQDNDKMEAYVHRKGWTTFEEMKAERDTVFANYEQLAKDKTDINTRMTYLKGLLDLYEKYEPYQKINAEYWKLKNAGDKKGKTGFLGFGKKSLAEEYKAQHQTELNTHRMYKSALKDMIEEPDKKIKPKAWREELETLRTSYTEKQKSYSAAVVDLAKMEVLKHNKGDLERMLENESHQRNREPRNRDHSL
ncbi:MAG: MobA/MobL family protein [Lachnospiraceae bacterium]|nr:MobA/MobL family protein [Lachnospiraceae bacterium]